MNAELTSPDISTIAHEMYARAIEPSLTPQDHGKFLALDINTGQYELDPSDQQAMLRLHARLPELRGFLFRVGYPAALHLGSPR
jgi:hypothetical protein